MFEEGCMVTVPNINGKAFALLKKTVLFRQKELQKKIDRIKDITGDENEYVEDTINQYIEELELFEYLFNYMWYYEKVLKAKESNINI